MLSLVKTGSSLKFVMLLTVLNLGAVINTYATCSTSPEYVIDADSVGSDSREIFFS